MNGYSYETTTPAVVEKDEDLFQKDNMLKLIFETLRDDKTFICGSLIFIGSWSAVCAVVARILDGNMEDDPDGLSSKWLLYLQSCADGLRLIGTLFSFSLVFRFKICYDRWWEGRKLWGGIIATCLDISMQLNRWVADEGIANRFNRFLIVYSYACKAFLKDGCLGDALGDGHALIKRGLLTKNELDELTGHPCWEPHFCLEIMRELLQKMYFIKGGIYLQEVNMSGQIYRCFDNSIKKLNDLIGDCISIKAANLPLTYDGIHHCAFYLYFTLAPIIWAPRMFWAVIPMSMFVAFIALCLIVLGTQLCDPFGDDKVDIPIDRFCKTIEVQIKLMQERRERRRIKELAETEIAKPSDGPQSAMPNLKMSSKIQL